MSKQVRIASKVEIPKYQTVNGCNGRLPIFPSRGQLHSTKTTTKQKTKQININNRMARHWSVAKKVEQKRKKENNKEKMQKNQLVENPIVVNVAGAFTLPQTLSCEAMGAKSFYNVHPIKSITTGGSYFLIKGF